MKKLLLAALALCGAMGVNAAELVKAHEGVFYNHFTDQNTPCTVNEYDDGTWTVDNAYGYEGMTMTWYINDLNIPIFTDLVDGNYGYYYYPQSTDWLAVYNDADGSYGYSAYEVTSYNGSDIWWYSYDSSWDNEGFDAIYWDLPEVLSTVTGTYENGLKEAPYEVVVETLANGKVRINDFYGYKGYPLYLDMTADTPIVANPDEEYEEGWMCYTGAWWYTSPEEDTWESEAAYIYKDGISKEYDEATGYTVKMHVYVAQLNEADDVDHVDVIKWQPNESGIGSVSAENAEGEAVYYNLQGVRVNRPTTGLYIKAQGGKASKVLVK